jgi:two-component system cell cycle sensor histidine kinase/response regulator CckA
VTALLQAGRPPDQFMASMLDAVAEILLVFDRHGDFVYANAAGRKYFEEQGSTPEESVSKTWAAGQVFEMPPGRLVEKGDRPLERALRGEIVPRREYLVTNLEGRQPFWLDYAAQPLRTPSGEIAGALVSTRNVTSRKVREAEATVQRQLLDYLYHGSLAGIIQTTTDGRLVDCNDALIRMFGYSSKDELLALNMADLYFFPGARGEMLQLLERVGELNEYEVCIRRKDGKPCWVLGNVFLLQPPADDGAEGGAKPPGTLVGTLIDITERKLWEESVKQSERRFSAFMEHLPGVAFIKDLDGRYVYYNDASFHLFGLKPVEIVGKTDFELWPRDEAATFRSNDAEVVTTRQPIEVTEPVPHADGMHTWLIYKFPIIESGEVVLVGGIGIDITERRQLEEKLTQAGKMEALGRLAGGVAHDFNNLLTLISGYGQLVLEGFGRTPEARLKGYVQEILTSALRASGLTGQMLAFSRRQNVQPTVFDLRELLHNLEQLLQRTIGEDVELVVRCGAEPCTVLADLHQMEQVLMNLAVNARDAMPLGGTLEIDCRRIEKVEDIPGKGPLGVLLEVRDTGIGMDESVKAHMFEPFFTSKERGKGTGLGLSTVYGVVSQAGGDVDVDSKPGEGSVFRIRLPLAERLPEEPRPVSEAPPTGGETVLVVEDEPSLRALAKTMLLRLGYEVVEAESGAHALELHSQRDGAFDILLTDVIMPQMSGAQLAVEMRKTDPALKVLFMSGYTDDMLVSYGVLEGETQLIQKPFNLERLGRAMRAVLDAPAAGGKPDAPVAGEAAGA